MSKIWATLLSLVACLSLTVNCLGADAPMSEKARAMAELRQKMNSAPESTPVKAVAPVAAQKTPPPIVVKKDAPLLAAAPASKPVVRSTTAVVNLTGFKVLSVSKTKKGFEAVIGVPIVAGSLGEKQSVRASVAWQYYRDTGWVGWSSIGPNDHFKGVVANKKGNYVEVITPIYLNPETKSYAARVRLKSGDNWLPVDKNDKFYRQNTAKEDGFEFILLLDTKSAKWQCLTVDEAAVKAKK